MAHHSDAEAQGQAPSYLALAEGSGHWFWWAQVPVAPFYVPLGIFTAPPPPELAEVDAVEVGGGNAAKAGTWITRRVHELVTVADKLRILPPP